MSVSLSFFLSLGALFCFPFTFLVNFPLKNFHLVIRKLEGTGRWWQLPSQLDNTPTPAFPSLTADEAAVETDRGETPGGGTRQL